MNSDNNVVCDNVAPPTPKSRGRRAKKCRLDTPIDISSDSMLWDAVKPIKNNNGYWFRYIWNPVLKKMHTRMEHTLVWERVNRKSVPQGYCIHHRDCDPNNNKSENLLCVPVVFHLELHAQLRKASMTLLGLSLEVERQRIIEQCLQKIDDFKEIWALVNEEITEQGMVKWEK